MYNIYIYYIKRADCVGASDSAASLPPGQSAAQNSFQTEACEFLWIIDLHHEAGKFKHSGLKRPDWKTE